MWKSKIQNEKDPSKNGSYLNNDIICYPKMDLVEMRLRNGDRESCKFL